MRKTTHATLFVLVVLFCWMSSFWMTRSRAVSRWRQDNPVWMQNVPNDIVTTEEQFCDWMETHIQLLTHERMTLGQLLESPESSDEDILAQVGLVASTHAELLRGVGRHLKTMRSSLPDSQKKLLTGFCHQALGNVPQQGGHGPQAGSCQQQGHLRHSGSGGGRKRGLRHQHCGLTRKLQLTDEQLDIAARKDPGFEEDIGQLQRNVLTEREKLYLLLEDSQKLNGQISQQIEHLIDAHNALEKRLVGYVLVMREHFTVDQQKRLIGLCRKRCGDC